MREAELKTAVSDYLEYGTNQGKWYADRLNSGEVIVVAGQSRRRVKLCREGTADFMILRAVHSDPKPRAIIPKIDSCRVIFIELKGDKGKTSPAQNAFKLLVEMQGAKYEEVRSIEELEIILDEAM